MLVGNIVYWGVVFNDLISVVIVVVDFDDFEFYWFDIVMYELFF